MSAAVLAAGASRAGSSRRGRRLIAAAVVVCVVVVVAPVVALVLLVAAVASGADNVAETDTMYSAPGNVSYSINGSTFVDGDANDNAWGGFSNGQIPAGELCAIAPAMVHEARCDAAQAFERMSAEFRATFGYDIVITDAYRSLVEQIATKRAKGFLAATPGYSNHGWGLAFDLASGISDYDSEQYAWMKANGSRFGFFHPTWAEPASPDFTKSEPWHWQYLAITPGGGGANEGTPEGNRALGQQMAAARGWSGEQWNCLEKLWTGESGWNEHADNPSSSAYGIPQALPGSKMAAAGADWQTNPATQITWGLDYVAGRYGSPCEALNAWTSRSPHWY